MIVGQRSKPFAQALKQPVTWIIGYCRSEPKRGCWASFIPGQSRCTTNFQRIIKGGSRWNSWKNTSLKSDWRSMTQMIICTVDWRICGSHTRLSYSRVRRVCRKGGQRISWYSTILNPRVGILWWRREQRRVNWCSPWQLCWSVGILHTGK